MPELADVHDEIRASGYSFDGYLNTPPREVIFAGTVTLYTGDPTFGLVYGSSTGNYTDVIPHMEVEVFSAGGASKGRLRVADGIPTTANTIQVNEVSRGRLKVEVGDTFVVYREWRLRDLLVGAALDFPKDSRITYTSQNALVAPLPLTGGHWAGKCDPGEDYATVPFFGTLSKIMDADSGGSKTYAWDVKDGTIVTGDDETGDIVVQFPPGKRWIDFTVTDASNGASRTQHVCVIVEDDDHPHIPCMMENLSGTRVGGWNMSFRVPLASFADIETLPDGQMILYHEDEHRAAGLVSYGNPIAGRSRLKFVGFLIRESIDIDPLTQTVTFEAVSPLTLLSLLPGFSQALLDQASANWQTYPSLTVLAAVVYLIVWGTTLPMLFDLDITGADDFPFAELFIQQNTPYLQEMELIEGISGELVCDRSARFFVQRKLTRSDATMRNAADVLLTLTAADVVEIHVPREHRYKSAQREVRGFTQGANGQPILSVAPGEAPAEAPDFTSLDQQIVEDQDELDDVAGWSYAEENSLYFGAPVPAEIEIVLRGGYDVGDFYKQWIVLDQSLIDSINLLARALNRYQVTATSRLLLQGVNISMDEPGGKVVTWTCSHETNGEKGTPRSVPPDEGATSSEYSWDIGQSIGIPLFAPGMLGGNTGRIGSIADDGHLYYTLNRGQLWQRLNLSPTGMPLDFISDPWSPKYITAGDDVWLHMITKTRIAKVEWNALTQGLTAYSNNETHSTLTTARIEMERAVRNLIVAVMTVFGTSNSVVRATDGVNWNSPVLINPGGGNWGPSGLYVSGKIPGRVYVGENIYNTNVGGKGSSNGAASFGALSSPNLSSKGSCSGLHIPWNDNNDTIAYFGNGDGIGARKLMRSVGSAAPVDISPTDGGESFGAQLQRSIDSYPLNRRIMAAALRNGDSLGGAGDTLRIYYTNDDWATKHYIAALDCVSGSGSKFYVNVRFAGDSPVFWAFGGGGAIALCNALTGSYEDWDPSGTLAAYSPGMLLNIFGF